MSDDVIKQFVVGLGWKVDKQGEKNVTEAIGGITKSVGVLVLALEAAALAAAAAVAKIAASFDQLYYTSQRTGASVQSIRSLSYAFGQVGSSSESAVAAIEAYAKAIRTNPGVSQYVKDLGVKQTGDAFKDLSAAVDKISAKNPYYAGAQMAGLLGMSEEQYLTFTKYRKEMASFQAEYDRTTKVFGLNNEDAAAASNKFMTSMRSLGMTVGVAGQAILVKLVPSFTAFLEKVRAWIETHPQEIEDAMRAIGAAALALAVAFGDIAKALTPVLNGFVAMSKALTGHEGLQASMEVFAAFLVGTWLVKILGAFGAVGSGWGALLLRLGIPVAIGLAASGGGHQTPEQYRESLRNNPAEAAADAERNARGGAGKRWWKRNMPTWLGGEPAAATDGIHRRGRRAAEADKKNYNFTGENADVLRQAAKELGTSPEDLATVISYESKFSPSVHGGTGNRYHGLIQFGGPERAQYGASDRQSFKEQMPAVVRYLKDRGFKPGMGLLDLYSTINAGRPGRYDASDGHGTVRSHVAKMQRDEAARVARFLASGSAQPAPAPVAPAPTAGGFNPSGFDVNKLTAAPALGSSTVNNTAGATVKMEHNTTIKIDGAGDPAATGAAVERAQGRANDLSLRNAQTAIR